MKISIAFVLLVVLALAVQTESFAALSILAKVANIGLTMTKGLMGHTWGVCLFKSIEVGWNAMFGAIFPKEDKIGETTNAIIQKFDEVENLISSSTAKTIESVSKSLMRTTKLAQHFDIIDNCLKFLQSQMKTMNQYSKADITDDKWRDFAYSLVEHIDMNSVRNQMETVFKIITDTDSTLSTPFLKNFVESFKRSVDNKRCELITSPQQTFIEFFRKMYFAETKTLILTTFAYRILSALENKPKGYTKEVELSTEKYMNRTVKFNEVMRKHAMHLDRDFFTCSYSEPFYMNKFIYGYMDSEWDILGTCTGECSYYSDKNNNLKLFENDPHHKCGGFVTKCRTTKNTKFDYCYASDNEMPFVYAWMSNDVLKTGSKDRCDEQNNQVRKKHKYNAGFVACDYCVCECHSEDDTTHRYLSLLPQMSNIKENKVIVGMRFQKYMKKLISLEVLEAPLQPFGYVDESKAEWRKLDPMLLPIDYWNFPGYHIMSASSRAMRMKLLEGPENSVLTGIKFIVKNGVPDISIRFTYFNFTSGIMDPKQSFWITESHEAKDTTDFHSKNPPNQCLEVFPDTESGQKILFGPTSFATDAGSSVVPYFDGKPVVPVDLMALSGAGILHKGTHNCGGLISPVVRTLPTKYFVDPEIDALNKIDPF